MGIDDQLDSLINEFADFLNGTLNKFDKKVNESNSDLVNNDNDLKIAVINEHSDDYVKKNCNKNFREITLN